MVVIRKTEDVYESFKIRRHVIDSTVLSQLHVYAEGNQWAWPVEGQISDYFGTRHGKHYGIDIAAPIGTPVSAIQEGKVTKSYYSSSYGNVIFIKHGEYEAVYAHLNKRYVVQGIIFQREK